MIPGSLHAPPSPYESGKREARREAAGFIARQAAGFPDFQGPLSADEATRLVRGLLIDLAESVAAGVPPPAAPFRPAVSGEGHAGAMPGPIAFSPHEAARQTPPAHESTTAQAQPNHGPDLASR